MAASNCSEYLKQWRAKNKSQAQANRRNWAARNKDRVALSYKQWAEKNKCQRAEYKDAWRARNQEKVQAQRIKSLRPEDSLFPTFLSLDFAPGFEINIMNNNPTPYEALCAKEEENQ